MGKDTDLLDKSVSFLQKRDGTDKLLKILRYSAKLVLATKVISPSSPASQRLKSFESSVGVSRKALRLGKFLQDVNELRRAPSFATTEGILELISSGGEGIYYFVEQFIWLVKAGAMDKSHGPRLQKLSALFELMGYTGSVTLKAMQVASLSRKEAAILKHIEKLRSNASSAAEKPIPLLANGALDTARSAAPQGDTAQGDTTEGDGTEDSSPETTAGMDSAANSGDSADAVVGSVASQQELISQQEAALKGVQFKRTLKLLSLIQDLSDSLLAFADVVDEDRQPRFLQNASFLAAAGLLSALISAHKNWVAPG